MAFVTLILAFGPFWLDPGGVESPYLPTQVVWGSSQKTGVVIDQILAEGRHLRYLVRDLAEIRVSPARQCGKVADAKNRSLD